MATLQIQVTPKPKIATESWFKSRWRPAMAWLYMALIVYDFMLMPILWPIAMFFLKIPFVAWSPLTLQGGALIHLAFGGVLGLYTWGRTKELTNGIDLSSDEVTETATTTAAVSSTTTTVAVDDGSDHHSHGG